MIGIILAIVISILVAAWLLRSQTPWKILTWGLVAVIVLIVGAVVLAFLIYNLAPPPA
jgi:UDP-N-acetylmuramyl pentapeptide phosphotransferase/UDP-N-acetylglucosamine-1-phosphate transferase